MAVPEAAPKGSRFIMAVPEAEPVPASLAASTTPFLVIAVTGT